MKTIKMGDTGPEVVELQKLLNSKGYQLSVDGQFGKGTDTAVRDYQRKQGLVSDGIVGQATWDKLQSGDEHAACCDFADVYYPLLAGQYVDAKVKQKGITLHHTVSAGSPYPVVDGWNRDNRGAVGTHFVIGGIGLDGSTGFDGVVMQCAAIEDWVYHMLTTRMGRSNNHNTTVNMLYVGIEICSFGCLQEKGGKFYTMDGTNREVPESMVEEIRPDWRTYKYWHRYSDKQVEAVVKVIKGLDKLLGLGLASSKYDKLDTLFDLSWDALNFRRVLTTHASFEADKFDAYPCERLIRRLKEEYPSLG